MGWLDPKTKRQLIKHGPPDPTLDPDEQEERAREAREEIAARLTRGGHPDLAALVVAEDRDTFDLKAEYRRWNKKLWAGALPDIPLKWSRSKTTGGKVVAVGIKDDPSTWKIKHLELSDFMDNTREGLLGLLIHEMVHVHLIANGTVDRGGHHGLLFKGELNRVARLVSFPVPLTDDITDTRVSKKVKAKRVGVVLFRDKPGIQVYRADRMPYVMDTLKGFPEGWVARQDILFLESDDRELIKYPLKRTINPRMPYFPIDREFADRLASEGRVLGTLG